jgi:two-component system sensor histidine kinase VicK
LVGYLRREVDRRFAALRQAVATLEVRVGERTAELTQAYEHLKSLSQAKDEFVSNVSHELRTPLTNLKLYHSLVQSSPKKAAPEYLETMQREMERLRHIIEDLLALSTIDQGQIAVDRSEMNLNLMADEYVHDRPMLAESRGLTLTLEQQPDLPLVQADERLLGQVLSILLTNALNYTPSGGRIKVSTHTRPQDEQMWVGFSVSDDGPGISSDELPHLFERFFRGSAAHESSASGTGLGPSIAKEIVDRHGRLVEVTSEGVPGKGATFSVWLPAN